MTDKIVTLSAYYDLMEAEIVRGRLEANGIACFIADDNIIASNPFYNQAVGGVKIKVFEHDVESCRKILAEESILTEEDTHITCPECQSTDIFYGPAPIKRNWFYLVVSALLGPNPYPVHRTWICRDCGTNFNLSKESVED